MAHPDVTVAPAFNHWRMLSSMLASSSLMSLIGLPANHQANVSLLFPFRYCKQQAPPLHFAKLFADWVIHLSKYYNQFSDIFLITGSKVNWWKDSDILIKCCYLLYKLVVNKETRQQHCERLKYAYLKFYKCVCLKENLYNSNPA